MVGQRFIISESKKYQTLAVDLENVNSESNLFSLDEVANVAFVSPILYKTSIPLELQIDYRISIPCQS